MTNMRRLNSWFRSEELGYSATLTRLSAVRMYGGGLFRTDLTDGDFGDEEIFAACFRAGEAAKHRDLTYMGERIGDRSLEERFGGGVQGWSDAR